MRKVIIFDFDGTLADTRDIAFDIFNELADEYNYKKIERKDIEKLRLKSARELFKEFDVSFLRLPFLIKEVKLKLQEKIKFLSVNTNLKKVLQVLKKDGYRMGIITSNNKQNVESFLLRNGLDMFDYIYTDSSLFGKDKVINKFIKKYKFQKEDVVYVGDEIRDIEAAQKAQIKIIAVSWGFNSKEGLIRYNPDFLINKPNELKTILANL